MEIASKPLGVYERYVWTETKNALILTGSGRRTARDVWTDTSDQEEVFGSVLRLSTLPERERLDSILSIAERCGPTIRASETSVRHGVEGFDNNSQAWVEVSQALARAAELWNATVRPERASEFVRWVDRRGYLLVAPGEALFIEFPEKAGHDEPFKTKKRSRIPRYPGLEFGDSQNLLRSYATDIVGGKLRTAPRWDIPQQKPIYRLLSETLHDFLWLYLWESMEKGLAFDVCLETGKWFRQTREHGGDRRKLYFDDNTKRIAKKRHQRLAWRLHYEDGLSFDQIASLDDFRSSYRSIDQVRRWCTQYDRRGVRVKKGKK